MKVAASQLSMPPLSEGTAPRAKDKGPVVESTTKAPPAAPKQVSDPIEIDNMRVRLRFKEDEETGIQVIQVIDPDSGKVVRQIPPEEILSITKALRDLKGLLLSRNS
jgi:flagellar protein FlaG